MQRLPRIHADPTALLHRHTAHVDPMLRLDQAGLLVRIAHARQVRADDLEVGVEAGVVGGHLEHAQVQEGDRREGAAGDQDQGRAVGGLDAAAEARVRELVLVEGHVAADAVGSGHGRRRGWCVRSVEGEESFQMEFVQWIRRSRECTAHERWVIMSGDAHVAMSREGRSGRDAESGSAATSDGARRQFEGWWCGWGGRGGK